MPILDQFMGRERAENDARELEPEHLEGFRRSQALAYACVTQVEKELHEGVTERDAARLVDTYLKDHGVREYFHRPFAWFGDRTAFTRFRTTLDFFPTGRRLEAGMPVILDVAPILDGHAADIGYACGMGENPVHEQMLADLEPYRQLILDGVRARKDLTAIYGDVDRLIERQGYKNRHQVYPFRVLAHRVNFVPPKDRSRTTVAGFGAPALGYLLGRMRQARRAPDRPSPLWNDRAPSRHAPEPGIWAVEPHLGFRGIGVKWEELLVITDTDAYWLDDALPHVERFQKLRRSSRPAVAREARP